MSSVPVFETQNADLASYLILEGVKFLGCSRHLADSSIVVLSFADEHGKCLDLERVFLNSEYKKYRDINKWLLGKIHTALRDLPRR